MASIGLLLPTIPRASREPSNPIAITMRQVEFFVCGLLRIEHSARAAAYLSLSPSRQALHGHGGTPDERDCGSAQQAERDQHRIQPVREERRRGEAGALGGAERRTPRA